MPTLQPCNKKRLLHRKAPHQLLQGQLSLPPGLLQPGMGLTPGEVPWPRKRGNHPAAGQGNRRPGQRQQQSWPPPQPEPRGPRGVPDRRHRNAGPGPAGRAGLLPAGKAPAAARTGLQRLPAAPPSRPAPRSPRTGRGRAQARPGLAASHLHGGASPLPRERSASGSAARREGRDQSGARGWRSEGAARGGAAPDMAAAERPDSEVGPGWGKLVPGRG